MNENSVPSANHSRSFVVSIAPPQPCYTYQRLTHYAHITISTYNNVRETHLDIQCPLHGFYASDAYDSHKEQDALDSVARFIVWMHGDRGRVVLLSPLEDPLSIPGYNVPPDESVDLLAWHARYEPVGGERIDSYVVYNVSTWTFNLFENGALVTERKIEQGV
jgi:hypothetical protein